MADKLIRSLARTKGSEELLYRLIIVESSSLGEHARKIHKLAPMGTLALARSLSGGLLLGALAKSERNVNLQIAGDGPLGNIFVDAQPSGGVRGYVQNNPPNPLRMGGVRPSLGLGLGQNGYVNVLRADPLGNYFRGTVHLQTGEIDDDIAEYLKSSDQVESAIALDAVLDDTHRVMVGGGVLLQALPSVNETSLDWAREKMRSRGLYKLMVREPADWPLHVADWLGLETEAAAESVVEWDCNCSEKRVGAALMGMGAKELSDIIEKEGKVDITCDFCREHYAFDRGMLSKLRDLAVGVALSHETPGAKDN